MNIRKILCLLLALTMLVLCGCDMIPSAGSNNIKVDDVKKIVITNGTGSRNTFTIENRDDIRTILNLFNGLKLENGTTPWKGWHYHLCFYDANGDELMEFSIVNKDSITFNDQTYTVNAKRLLDKVEVLECDTLTDEELLRTLFEGNYFDDVSILNEDGAVSLDKILSIKNDCPALFELLTRPSAIQSLGTYGMELLEEYLNSEDSHLRQKAQEIAEVLKNFFPSIKDKIEEISKK